MDLLGGGSALWNSGIWQAYPLGGPGAPLIDAPAAFTDGDWAPADSPSANGNRATLNIADLPDDGGAAITALQWREGTGAAQALVGVGTGIRNLILGAAASLAPVMPAPMEFDHDTAITAVNMATYMAAGYRTGPYALAADSAPLIAGLSLNTVTGQITGTPTEARGNHRIKVESSTGGWSEIVMAAKPDLNPANYAVHIDGQTYTGDTTLTDGANYLVTDCVVNGGTLGLRNCPGAVVYNCTVNNAPTDGLKMLGSGSGGNAGAIFYGCTVNNAGRNGVMLNEDLPITHTDARVLNIEVNTCGTTSGAPGSGAYHGIYCQSPDALIEGGQYNDCQAGNGVSIRSSGVVRGVNVDGAYQSGVAYYPGNPAGPSNVLLIEQNELSNVATDPTRRDINLLLVEPVNVANRVDTFTIRNNVGTTIAYVNPGDYDDATITSQAILAEWPTAPDYSPDVDVQIRAVNSEGPGAWSPVQTVTPTILADSFEFGALTRAGAGAIPAPAGATSITGGTATGYTLSGGLITPTANGSATAGTLTFDSGDPITIVLEADEYSVASIAELQAAMGAADLSADLTFRHRDAAALSPTAGRADLSGYAVSGRWIVTTDTKDGAYLPGLTLANSDNITVTGFDIERHWNGETITNTELVIEVTGSDGITVTGNTIHADPLTTYGGWAAAPTKGIMQGVGTPGAVGCTNLTVAGNTMYNLARALRTTNSSFVDLLDNNISDCYQSFWEFQGDDFNALRNNGIGLWAHGGGAGQTGPNNPGGDPGIYPYDWGDSHSGLYGTGEGGANHKIKDNVLSAGINRYVALGDYYPSASGGKYNDSAQPYVNCENERNIFISTDNTGLQIARMQGGRTVNNTIAILTEAGLDTVPNINMWQLVDHEVSHNVACAFVTLTGTPESLNFDQDFLDKSWNNVIALHPGQGGITPTVAGDAMSYDQLFTGPFTGLDTADKIRDAFTPLPGARLTNGPRVIGGVGYFDPDTGTVTPYPEGAKPKTATATGVTLDRVDFASGVFARAQPPADFDGATGFTMIWAGALDPASDSVDMYLAMDSSNAFVMRRKPLTTDYNAGGRVEFYFEDAAGGNNMSVQSSLPLLGTDGFKVVVLSVDFTDYNVQLLVGPDLDPSPRVFQFRGNPAGSTGVRHDIMPSGVGSVERFLMIDKALDLHDQATLNALVALDGTAPSYGADGSGAVGETPPVYLAGDALAWNAGGGLNLGDDAADYVMQGGTVTDSVLSAPVNTVAASIAPTGSPIVGTVLTVTPGTWTGSPYPQFTYQWQAGGVDIAGETGLTYTTADPGDSGVAITCVETATNSVSAISQASNAVTPISAGGNIVPDPGFDDPSKWTDTDGPGTVIEVTGGAAVFTETPGFWQIGMAASDYASPVTGGAVYDMSVDVVAVEPGTRVRIAMESFNGAASLGDAAFLPGYSNAEIDTPQTLSSTFTAHANATHLRWYIQCILSSTDMQLDNLSITPQ